MPPTLQERAERLAELTAEFHAMIDDETQPPNLTDLLAKLGILTLQQGEVIKLLVERDTPPQ